MLSEVAYRDLRSELPSMVKGAVDEVLRRPIAYGGLLIYGPTVEQVLCNLRNYIPWFLEYKEANAQRVRSGEVDHNDLIYEFLFGPVHEG